MNKKRLLMLMGGSKKPPIASIGVTTTGAETLTISELTVATGKEVVVDWGDGLIDTYSGAGARTHNYAGAGTWNLKFGTPENITVFNCSDNKVTLNSKDVKKMVNITDFRITGLKAGTFDSADISAWRPSTFYLYSMPAGYEGTFDSADVSAWRPIYFYLHSMPTGYAGTFDSTDISAWRPTNFRLYSMPTGYAGTFDSADVSAWRPIYFYLYSMPAGYEGTFDSADVSAWRPIYFRLYSMPTGYAGTFDSADVSAWRPIYFYLHSMPTGYAGTFDSADVSAWRPTNFYLYTMPVATFTITISANGFAGWVSTTNFEMKNNSLSQAQVDQILADFWAGFATRTATGGTINVGTNNAAPSGVYQAANPPTTGLEYRYELLNDSQNINPTKKWATITVAA
jgi:hypothetical protein